MSNRTRSRTARTISRATGHRHAAAARHLNEITQAARQFDDDARLWSDIESAHLRIGQITGPGGTCLVFLAGDADKVAALTGHDVSGPRPWVVPYDGVADDGPHRGDPVDHTEAGAMLLDVAFAHGMFADPSHTDGRVMRLAGWPSAHGPTLRWSPRSVRLDEASIDVAWDVLFERLDRKALADAAAAANDGCDDYWWELFAVEFNDLLVSDRVVADALHLSVADANDDIVDLDRASIDRLAGGPPVSLWWPEPLADRLATAGVAAAAA